MSQDTTPPDGDTDDEVQSPDGARRRAREADERAPNEAQLRRRRERYAERKRAQGAPPAGAESRGP